MSGLRVLLRAAPWRALSGLSAAGAGLGAVGVAVGGGTGQRILQLALVVLGSAAACALDEPAAAVAGACPVARWRQLLVKALAAVPALLAGLVVLLGWQVRSTGEPVLLLELSGPWALGFALAVLARSRLDEPGEVVAPALALVLGTLAMLNPLYRWVDLFPLGPGLRTVPAWSLVLASCALAVLLTGRERRWRALP